jgi:hypothetical protein
MIRFAFLWPVLCGNLDAWLMPEGSNTLSKYTRSCMSLTEVEVLET